MTRGIPKIRDALAYGREDIDGLALEIVYTENLPVPSEARIHS